MPRPHRYAALIIGAPVSEVLAKDGDALPTSRGVVVLGNRTVANEYEEVHGVATWEVTRFLDDGTLLFHLDGTCKTFRSPPEQQPAPGSIPVVEGETEPRAITRKLGIPEAILFPKD